MTPERAVELVLQLRVWASAFPPDRAAPEEYDRMRRVLIDAGLNPDRFDAGTMRHVLKGVLEILDAPEETTK